jgi:hypothetical protein
MTSGPKALAISGDAGRHDEILTGDEERAYGEGVKKQWKALTDTYLGLHCSGGERTVVNDIVNAPERELYRGLAAGVRITERKERPRATSTFSGGGQPAKGCPNIDIYCPSPSLRVPVRCNVR